MLCHLKLGIVQFYIVVDYKQKMVKNLGLGMKRMNKQFNFFILK